VTSIFGPGTVISLSAIEILEKLIKLYAWLNLLLKLYFLLKPFI
jgi:hypothetical protein